MKLFTALVSALFLTTTLAANAATLHLIDGTTVTGTIKRIDANYIIVDSQIIPKNRVASIDALSADDAIDRSPTNENMTTKDIPLTEKPGYWFAWSAVNLVAGILASNAWDEMDADADKLKISRPDRTPVYLWYGLAAVTAVKGLTLVERDKARVSVSRNGGTTWVVARQEF